jgi:hypothetical protein
MIKTAMRMSTNVEVMPTPSNGCNIVIIAGEIVRRIRAMLLTCKPGRRPVRIPVITPRMQNTRSKTKGSINYYPSLLFDIGFILLHFVRIYLVLAGS